MDVQENPAVELHEEPDMTDQTFFRTLSVGALIGIPASFALALLAIALTSYWSVTPAFIWTAIVAGPYLGGFIALNVLLGHLEARRRRAASPEAAAKVSRRRRAAAAGHPAFGQ